MGAQCFFDGLVSRLFPQPAHAWEQGTRDPGPRLHPPAARTRVGTRPGIFERSSELTAMSRSRSLCTKRSLYSADYSPGPLCQMYTLGFSALACPISPEGRVPRRQAITAVSMQPTLGFAGWFAPPHPQRLPLGVVQLQSTARSGWSDRKAASSAWRCGYRDTDHVRVTSPPDTHKSTQWRDIMQVTDTRG